MRLLPRGKILSYGFVPKGMGDYDEPDHSAMEKREMIRFAAQERLIEELEDTYSLKRPIRFVKRHSINNED